MRKLGFDLIFLGAPASGKDTQAGLLTNHYALKRIESGEYFRKLMKRKDALGAKVKSTVGQAKPAPVALMKMFLANAFKKIPKDRNLVFVGNPKLKPEAQFLVKNLKRNNRDFLAFYIKLPAKEIIKRSFFRMRHDDLNKQLIQKRINWHKDQVGKTVKYFESIKKLKYIDGNQPPLMVARDIQKAINDYQKSRGN
ncbi:MAG: nucleoside monophosphate kinase [Candidatus Doudnabacteria bacterium]|nr:nucleoside monophosphate kinase [Candidatus Doudnabacteria bacterium]